MTMFINQMLGCLIIAAGIGGAVGWLLKQVSVGKGAHLLADVTAMMRLKEQMLAKAREELRASASEMKELESQIGASEALDQSNQEQLGLRQMRIQTLQEELTAAKQQLSTVETGQTTLHTRLSENEARTIAQADETRLSQAALETAQQGLTLKEQELRSSHERLVVLESQCADTDRLRARVQELEPTQGRVHWLEGQLSERGTQHRAALDEVELQLAERDRRIRELEQLHQQLKPQAEGHESPPIEKAA
ncbi:MAG: hypothetical protein ABI988_20485 [Nitrospirota bacterium]